MANATTVRPPSFFAVFCDRYGKEEMDALLASQVQAFIANGEARSAIALATHRVALLRNACGLATSPRFHHFLAAGVQFGDALMSGKEYRRAAVRALP